ncbi:6-hydroxymethylpterin diphosphokinase MptE-like protein [Malaciobacter marinus]|uniref:motility associated factor glycosyltransferase family protein n=1 Tax=Malaciobacter marinus TaxID=505249 RepID=UPI003B001034
MQEELDNLTQTLFNLYLKNMEFLEKKHPNTYKKVQKLSKDIEEQNHKERYTLEYIKEGGYFDIFDHTKDKFLYDFNSYEEADKRAELTNFTKDNSLDLLRIDPRNKKLAIMHSLGIVATLANYINHKVDFTNVTFSKIYKFIFIGVGAGVHLNEVYKKVNSMNTLIIEPELELFRLTLFTTDYTVFEQGNKKLFLSICETPIQREKTIEEFTHHHNYMNYNIKHHLFWIDYKYILDELISYYSTNHPASFPFGVVLKVLYRTIRFMKDKEKFIKKQLIKDTLPLKNKKVLIISAGPSVDNHLEWIKKYQDRFVIVCVDVILKKLEKNSIVPDIVVSIDPSPECGKFLKTEDKNFLKNSAIIFLSQQEESVLKKVEHLNYYFSQVYPVCEELGYSFSLPNVGTFSFAMSVFLKANELYLVGNDAAFNQETGDRYASDSSHEISDLIKEKHIIDDNIVSDYDILEVKGNLREKIKSNRTLLTFKRDYELFIHSLDEETKKTLKAYNLSDGAFMEGLIPLDIKDIDLQTLEKKDFNVKEILDNISCTVENIDFEDDAKVLSGIITKVNKFKKTKISSRDDFLQKKLDIMIWILQQKKHMSNAMFANVFLKYIELVDIYVNFFLNLKQNQLYTQKNLSEVKKYWCDSTILVLKDLKVIINQE